MKSVTSITFLSSAKYTPGQNYFFVAQKKKKKEKEILQKWYHMKENCGLL